MKRAVSFFMLCNLSLFLFAQSNAVEKFSLSDVIRIASEQSLDAILAKHRFRASYWAYRSYKAEYLPGLTLSGTIPNFDRSVNWDENTQSIVEKNSITNFGQLSLSQNFAFTGGSISLQSDLQQINQLDGDGSTRYISTPISISYAQPLFTFNSMRWDRKIEPLIFEEAKNSFVESMEGVSGRAVSRFFDLALAQLNLKIAQTNYSNSDTLLKIAQGRYNIGTIAENDLLQMQLSYLNAKTSLTKAEIDLELQKNRLRSFLGFNEKMDFDLILPSEIPPLQVNFQNVLDLAMKNNPDVIAWQRRKLETSRDVAQAKGDRKNIELAAAYGLDHNRTASLQDVYQAPFNDKQQVRVSLRMPIVDWGKGRGKVKMAQSNQELVDVQIQQEQIDFEQNIYLQVTQFNLQREQVQIASISDTIGQKRYDVTKQRFLIGRIDVLNLNDALREKDSAKRGYISALREYWSYYYILRQLSLFDFVNNAAITKDFDNLIDSK